jgi:hypothetical protein
MARPSEFTQEIADEVAIYALIDPRDGSTRYIGKANDVSKRLSSHLRDSRRRDTPVYRWVRKLARLGLSPHIEVISTCSDQDWPEAEREEIKKARESGARLLNVAEGGNQPLCTPEIRASNGRRAANSRDKRKWRLMRALGSALKQGYVSDATKARMRARPDVFGQFARYL